MRLPRLAAETGQPDVWEVAAEFAAAMLPGIFRQDDPILAMRLPIEARQELERLLDRLPAEVITAEDSLGWVYQYWQTKRKNEVNKSERKIGGADLAPVTQLFTENYMVRFLLENSLGAWWAARHPDSPLLAGWEYLRRDDDGAPAVGGFDGWPERVAEVTVMDPCCGSGHFLTAAFGMLWRMRAEEEGLDPAAAQDAVLRDNLFGLELDPRCTQIAAFALALEAWKAGGYRPLPLPNIACSGIPARAPLADWLELAGGDPLSRGRAHPPARPVRQRRHPRLPHRPRPSRRTSRPGIRRLGGDRPTRARMPSPPKPANTATTLPPPSSAQPPPASPAPPTTSAGATPSSPPTRPT